MTTAPVAPAELPASWTPPTRAERDRRWIEVETRQEDRRWAKLQAKYPALTQDQPAAGGGDLSLTDLFCGAGGSSSGAVQVPGVTVRIAANHWDLAVAVHNLNHPNTDHSTADLHKENPRFFPRTDLLWASPECTKWSQANGKKLPAIEEGLFEDPLSNEAAQRSRLLMFDVLKFAEHHRYQVMIIENVVDIATQAKYRLAWQVWRQDLMKLGYRFRVVSLNSMHAQAFGAPAPQSRDRIYIVCWLAGTPAPDLDSVLRPSAYCSRCAEMIESQQAFKPGKTVGRYRQSYVYVHAACGTVVEPGYLPAAAAIDWSVPGELIGNRLKPKTRARIAAGIARYWGPIHLEANGNSYDAANPNHPRFGDPDSYYRAWSTDDVLRTLHHRVQGARGAGRRARRQERPTDGGADADPDNPRRDCGSDAVRSRATRWRV